MAFKVPIYQSTGQPPRALSSPLARPDFDAAGVVVARAATGAIKEVEAFNERMYRARVNTQVATAKTDLSLALSTAEQGYQERDDFANFETDHEKVISGIKKKVQEEIRDTEAQARLGNWFRVETQKSRIRVATYKNHKENQYNRAKTTENIALQHDKIDAPDRRERYAAVQEGKRILAGALADRVILDSEALAGIRKFNRHWAREEARATAWEKGYEQGIEWLENNPKMELRDPKGQVLYSAHIDRGQRLQMISELKAGKVQHEREVTADIADAVEPLLKEAYREPDSVKEIFEQGLGMITRASASFSEDFAGDRAKVFKEALFETAFLGRIENDPEGALKEIKAGSWDQALDVNQIIKLKETAERAVNAKERERNQAGRVRLSELKEQMRNERESVFRTGQRLRGMDIAGELKGLDPELGAEHEKDLVRAEASRNALVETRNMSLPDRLDHIEQFKPEPGDPEDFSEKQKIYDALQKAVISDWKVLEKDPAAYLARQVEEEIQGLMESGDLDEEDETGVLTARVEKSVALQRALGLNEEQVSILPLARAAEITAAYNEGDPEKKLKIITGLKSFQQYESRVLGELDLGYAHTFAAGLPAHTAKKVLKVLTMPDSEFGMDSGTRKDLKVETSEAFYDDEAMGGVLTALADITGNPEYMTMARDLESLSVKMSYLHGNPEKASEELWRDTSFMADEDLAYIHYPASFDEDEVADALIEYREKFLEKALSYRKDTPGHEQYVSDLKERGVWIPAPDGEGFILIDPTAGRAVSLSNGDYFRFSLDRIRDDFAQKQIEYPVSMYERVPGIY